LCLQGHSFSWLYGIPLYEYTTKYLPILLLMDICVVSTCSAVSWFSVWISQVFLCTV
jgi:hypothetical protein